MWAEDDFEDSGGRWGAIQGGLSREDTSARGGRHKVSDQEEGQRSQGNWDRGRGDDRSPRDRYRDRDREEARRYSNRADDGRRNETDRRPWGTQETDRRGARGEPRRDWIPDRFNRSDDGGRPREDTPPGRDTGGRGRGYVRGGGRGRGRQDDSGTDELPPLYSIHRATVQSVRPFGMFVKLEGYRKNGLVHVTQVSEHEVTRKDDPEDAKVEALRGVAPEGDQVWVKVISIKEGEGGGPPKMACSLKLVSQADGRDLDLNNLILDKYERKPAGQEPKKFELGAVLDVTCTRCGGHGHLKTDCYAALDTQYDLLPEEDDTVPSTGGVGPLQNRGQGSGANDTPLGRGRGMTQPAWMTQANNGDGHVIGQPPGGGKSGRSGGGPNLPAHIGSVEEALAVIEKLKEEKRERKARRKERRKAKEKKRKKQRKAVSDDEESSSEESESEGERKRRKERRKERRERKRRKREKSGSASSSDSEDSRVPQRKGTEHKNRDGRRKRD